MNAIRYFLKEVPRQGQHRETVVHTVAMGRERNFHAWDIGQDTFIFEEDINLHLDEHPSVLIVKKSDLYGAEAFGRPPEGWVMTITTGNHSVAALPLLDGRFWHLADLQIEERGETLIHSILCANLVCSLANNSKADKAEFLTIETSQRDLTTQKLCAADEWLLSTGYFKMDDIIMGDRNENTIEHYRHCGQEWRVKPLAWTENEMRVALSGARKRITTKLRYYHSSRGVHFLTYPDFIRFTALAETAPEEFIRGLRELVSIYEGQRCSFIRMPKYRGHHEIEFFGVRRGVALERLIPTLEMLMEAIVLGRIDQAGIVVKAQEIAALFLSQLSNAEFANAESKIFIETLYMYVTGEIYLVSGEGSTPAFDDRRTALPGATFTDGVPRKHPRIDARSEFLLTNLRGLISRGETIEYANVYELREDETAAIGEGKTREIVYKTNRGPLEIALIEKRLSSSKKGYDSYMLSRIGAMRSLGIILSARYILLRRIIKSSSPVDVYLRDRCEGEPMDSIPAAYFRNTDDSSIEEKDVVLELAHLMGDAAAQNMAMKKYDKNTDSPLYGIGKEIYDFGYDIQRRRIMPKKVSTCSIRGSFGWPNLETNEENFRALTDFYSKAYAKALMDFRWRHDSVTTEEVFTRFFEGFTYRTHALVWQLSVMRDQFESFQPKLPPEYDFERKWSFMLWSLERQERRLRSFEHALREKIKEIENESLRNNS